MKKREYTIEIGGQTLTAEFNDLAEQANGSVMLRYGNTTVLATAVMSESEREGLPYFPLTVDYEEKFYAAGAILGSRFLRREGRPSEEAILSGRVIDRTIRPLFENHIRNEVQIIVTVLSIDEDDPDVLGINAASLALLTSDIPWRGPVSAVRIAKHQNSDAFGVNPRYVYRGNENNELDMIICGRNGLINMIEVGAHELGEQTLGDAFVAASAEIEKVQTFQSMIAKEIGKEKCSIPRSDIPAKLTELFEEHTASKLPDAFFSGAGKKRINDLKKLWMTLVADTLPEIDQNAASDLYEERVDALLHKEIIENERRADGRKLRELRDLFAQAGGLSPVLHGSGLFYRGGTHVFSALTLGGPEDTLIIDSMEEQESKKRFMHHYNFPPFSAGETGRLGGLNRRMIGHGALAEKALAVVIPPKETFPYTIRLVSESMASNGSTSMASVCAGALALMDGGVPIKAPVAGIAMGLAMNNEGSYKILTDIQGPEDHHGDMDFKVAGTRKGVTAIQMDVKVDGVPLPILREALEQAREARHQILDVMQRAIETPRPDISPRAPKIITLNVKVDQIGLVIGSGGKTINKIKDDSGVEGITIEDDGTIFITGRNGTAEEAQRIILELTHEYKAGERLTGEVVRLMDFGAFVKLSPYAEGLVHISEIAPFRIDRVANALSIGEKVPVVVKEIDEKERINLSIKDADPEFAKQKDIARSENRGHNKDHERPRS